ncbi:tryptophan--tRNA ligase, partial [Dysosmobacter welbionis]
QEVLGILGFGAAVIHVAGAGDHLADVHIVVLHHISGVSLVGIGAHIVAIIDPLAGGMAEDVGGILLLQVLEILLAELHQAVAVALAIDVAVGVGIVFHVLAGGSGVDGDVAHNDGVLLVILDHGGLQHVEGVQGGLLTGHSLGAHELVVAVVQTDAAGLLDDADLPVGAGVALDGAVIAQSAQQHLHERVAAQGAGGTEGAVSIAADDTLLRAVGDVAREGVGHGNILKGSGACAERGGGGGAQDQVADDLGGRATGQDIIGTEVAVGITVDNTQGRDHIHSFFVGDLAVVREVLGAGADGDQRHGHHQSKHQRKELLHWDFSSFKKFAVRRKTPG